jgi:hypothetical protein
MPQHPYERRFEVIQRILVRGFRGLEPLHDSVSDRWEISTEKACVDLTALTLEISDALGWPPKHQENEEQRQERVVYQDELRKRQLEFRLVCEGGTHA